VNPSDYLVIGLLGGFGLAFHHILSDIYLNKYIYWAFYPLILVAHHLRKYSRII
jgi:hypothetical protein